MNLSEISLGAIGVAVLMGAASFAATGGTNLLVNGGFESPKVPISGFESYYASSSVGGWIVSAGVVDLVDTNHFGSASGLQSLDLNGDVAGGVYQDIETLVGERYRLRFAFAANPVPSECARPGVRRMEVRWNSNLLATVEHDVSGYTATHVGWRDFSFMVEGSGRDRVSFLSLAPGCTGPAIDNVSVTQAANSINAVEGIMIERAVQICWPTRSERMYQVQWASRAETNIWSYLGQAIRGDGSTNCISDPFGTNLTRFYRVLEVE